MGVRCGLDLHFANNDVEHLFTCVLAICISLGGDIAIQVLCPFLIKLFVFCYCCFHKDFTWYKWSKVS